MISMKIAEITFLEDADEVAVEEQEEDVAEADMEVTVTQIMIILMDLAKNVNDEMMNGIAQNATAVISHAELNASVVRFQSLMMEQEIVVEVAKIQINQEMVNGIA